MGSKSKIGWTDHTFNISWGCRKWDETCDGCYAEELANRYGFDVWGGKSTPRRVFGEKHWNEPLKWNKQDAYDCPACGSVHYSETPVECDCSAVGTICYARSPRVFCSSMCDVFEDHPTIDQEREKLWPLIRSTPNLTWLILTKRIERAKDHLPSDWGKGYENVIIGTSVGTQKGADIRIPQLRAIPARRRMLSVEPLIEPINFVTGHDYLKFNLLSGVRKAFNSDGACSTTNEGPLDWLIVGLESGGKRRDCGVEALVNIAAQSVAAGVPCYVKQDCAFKPGQKGRIPDNVWDFKQFPK